MNATTYQATHIASRNTQLRLAPANGIKLATCATLSLLITLLTVSVIGQATAARSIVPAVYSAPALTASLR